MQEYVRENLEKGFIRPSSSPAGAGFFFVKKKDGSLRPCIDYRGLNNITVKNRYPLPLIDDLFSQVAGAKVFSKLDLRGAYNLVRIREGDEWKTAFNTQDGHYEYLVMPFGLCNAPAVFQDFVNEVFREVLGRFVIVYLDDILVFSKDLDHHRDHVKYVLQKLRENSLCAKLEKCQFEVREIPFLGYIISDDGLTMDQGKVAAVLDWPQPVGLKPLQRFLGFANYYRRFIKNFSRIVAPLTNLTKKDADPCQWSPEAVTAFSTLKKAFCTAPILKHADVLRPFIVEVDASEVGVGAVLSQYSGQPERLHPCAFFSRKFSPAEKNYDIGNRELLAVKMAFEEWRHWLEGAEHTITVFTDHKNLEYIEGAKRLSPRQARWSLFFSRFKFIITYKPGSKNVKADALSRCFEPENVHDNVPEKILPDQVVVAVANVSQDLLRSLSRFQGEVPHSKPPKLLFVPIHLRLTVLLHFHDSKLVGHPGVNRTQELLLRHLWWPNLRADVKDYIAACSVCAKSKTSRSPPVGLLQSLPIPSHPWSHISMDFVTDLPMSEGNTVIWVVTDRFSKMGHFIPLRKLPSAQELADLFVKNIFKIHGIPDNIVSDRGVQFVSKFWRSFCGILGISLSFSSGFHPQTNGQTERLNQDLEQYLRCYVSEAQEDWVKFIPFAEFAHNSLQNSSTRYSPFQVVFGKDLKFSPLTPVQSPFPALQDWADKMGQLWSVVKGNIEKSVSSHKRQADRHRVPEREFQKGDPVWVSTRNIPLRQPSAKLGPRFIGPYPILEKINEVTYKVDLPAQMKGVRTFHVSLLKAASSTVVSPPPPVVIDGQPEYELEKILDSRRHRGNLQYLVHWKGYGPEERSWEPASSLHAQELVQEFHASHPDSPSPACSETTPQGGGNVRNRELTARPESVRGAAATAGAGDVRGAARRGRASQLQLEDGRARVGRRPPYTFRRRVS